MKVSEKCKSFVNLPLWKEEKTLWWLWISTGVIYALIKFFIGKYNNYKIFKYVFPHSVDGVTLYGNYPEYYDWFERLQLKNAMNMFADPQNISFLGMIRKISGSDAYSDLWLIIPALILFFIPYLRISQYKHLSFRIMLLANVLLFVVLFSTGTEASGYITAMIGVALWYICSPSEHKKYNLYLLVITLVVVGLSTTELIPRVIRTEFIRPYVLKAWPVTVVWLTVCYEMIFLDFARKQLTWSKEVSL